MSSLLSDKKLLSLPANLFQYSMMPIALGLLLLATAWRVLAVHNHAFDNFSPLMALTFCTAVYVRDKRFWAIPFLALTLSDLYIDHYYSTVYNYQWTWGGPAIRALCFVGALAFGAIVARHRSWLKLLAGCLGGAILFYLVTNTSSWMGDAAYAHDAFGWWQAMTVGHPEFPPTLFFFRNTLVSDLIFTAIFAFTMEYVAAREGASSLLANRVRVGAR